MKLTEYRRSYEYRKSIERFADDMLVFHRNIRPHVFKLPTPQVHYEFRDLAMDVNTFHSTIISPRDSAKSSHIAEGLPLWHIFCEDIYVKDPEIEDYGDVQRFLLKERPPKFIPVISKTQKHAIRRLRAIKNALGNGNKQSRILLAHFGDWGQKTATKWTDTEVILKDGTVLLALGTGQQARGLNEDAVRPTLAINDDPEDENNTKTPEALEENMALWLDGFLKGIAVGGRAYTIGTPIRNDRCMVLTLERMSKNMPRWTCRRYKFLNRRADGTYYSLWPERLSVEDLIAEREALMREGKVYSFYQERQCEIRGREDQVFRHEDFRYCRGYATTDVQGRAYLVVTHEGVTEDSMAPVDEGKVVPVNVYRGLDPAATANARSDHTVILTRLYHSKKVERHLIDEAHYVFRVHRFKTDDPDVIASDLVAEHKMLPANFTGVEQVNFQAWLAKTVKKEADAQQVYLSGINQKITPSDAKSKRYILDLKPLAKKGAIWIVLPPPEEDIPTTGTVVLPEGGIEFVDEAVMFRVGRDGDDDQLDALWNSEQQNYPPNHEPHMLSQKKQEPRPTGRRRSRWDAKKDWRLP